MCHQRAAPITRKFLVPRNFEWVPWILPAPDTTLVLLFFGRERPREREIERQNVSIWEREREREGAEERESERGRGREGGWEGGKEGERETCCFKRERDMNLGGAITNIAYTLVDLLRSLTLIMWQKFGGDCSNCIFKLTTRGRYHYQVHTDVFRPWPCSCDRNLGAIAPTAFSNWPVGGAVTIYCTTYLFRPWLWSCDRNLGAIAPTAVSDWPPGALSLSLHTVICSGPDPDHVTEIWDHLLKLHFQTDNQGRCHYIHTNICLCLSSEEEPITLSFRIIESCIFERQRKINKVMSWPGLELTTSGSLALCSNHHTTMM